MKNKGWMIFALGLITLLVMGAKIGSDILKLGNKTAENITIEFDIGTATNPVIRWNDTAGELQFSNDGSNFLAIGSGGGAGTGINIVSNADFEGVSGGKPTDWTESAGVLSHTTLAAEVGNGGGSGKWDASATSETLVSLAAVIPNSLDSKACLAKIDYRWDAGVFGELVMRVEDGGTPITSDLSLNVPASGVWAEAQISFICPAGGNLRIVIASTADAAEILLDDAHLGSDFRRGVVGDEAELVAMTEYPATAGCNPFTASTSLVSLGTIASCPPPTVIESGSFDIDVVDDDLLTIKINSAPPGIYTVTAMANTQNSAGAGNRCNWAISDGTDIRGVINPRYPSPATSFFLPITIKATFEYSSTGDRTFEIFGAASASQCEIENIVFPDARTTFIVERYPNTSPRDTITLDSQGDYWDLNIGGANASLGTASVSSYTEITDPGLDLVINPGSQSADIACATGTASTGLTCSVDESVGVQIDVKRAGVHKACFEFSHFQDATTFTRTTFQIVETTNTSSAIVTEGNSRTTNQSGSDDSIESFNLCSVFDWAPGKHTLRLEFEQTASGTTSSSLQIDRGASQGQQDLRILIYPLTENHPQAIAIADVETGATGDCTTGNICSGTYTPTDNNNTNLDSVTLNTSLFTRIGNNVCVFLYLNIDPTSSSSDTGFDLTLPISTNITAVEDAAGNVACSTDGTAVNAGYIKGIIADDEVRFDLTAASSQNLECGANFCYLVQ